VLNISTNTLNRYIIPAIVILSLILTVSVMAVNATGEDYSNYDYPQEILDMDKTFFTDRGGSFWDSSDDIYRGMTEKEIHYAFYKWCTHGRNYDDSYFKPECLEIIIDAKLKPINDKLDYLVHEREKFADKVSGVQTFDEWFGEKYDRR